MFKLFCFDAFFTFEYKMMILGNTLSYYSTYVQFKCPLSPIQIHPYSIPLQSAQHFNTQKVFITTYCVKKHCGWFFNRFLSLFYVLLIFFNGLGSTIITLSTQPHFQNKKKENPLLSSEDTNKLVTNFCVFISFSQIFYQFKIMIFYVLWNE